MFKDSIDQPYDYKTEFHKRCCCFCTVNTIIRFLVDATVFALYIVFCIFLKNNDYGEFVFDPIYYYAIGSLVLYIVYISWTFYLPCVDLNSGTQIAVLLISIVSIAFTIKCYTFTSDKFAQELTDLAYVNWNVDMSYMSFQSNHGCDGLKALNSTCEMCCDEDFYIAVKDKLSEYKFYIILILAFQLYSFITLTLPNCIFEVVCG